MPTHEGAAAMWRDAQRTARIGLSDVSFCAAFGPLLVTIWGTLAALVAVGWAFVGGHLTIDGDDQAQSRAILGGAVAAALLGPYLLATVLQHALCLRHDPVGPYRQPVAWQVDVRGTTTAPNETKPYRSGLTKELQSTFHPSVKTLDDLWRFNLKRYANDRVYGTRQLQRRYTEKVTIHGKEKKFNRAVFANEYRWETWSRAEVDVGKATGGLTVLMDQDVTGAILQNEEEPVTRHVGIFANTCPQFQKTMQACFRGKMPLCTVYATLGSDGLAWAVHLCEIRILVTEADKLPVIAKMAGGVTIKDDGKDVECTAASLRTLVVFGTRAEVESQREALRTLASRPAEQGGPVRVITFAELLQIGGPAASGASDHDLNAIALADMADADPARALTAGAGADFTDGRDKPTADDMAVIMFTSGTSGLPKGVMILHRNLLAAAYGLQRCVPECSPKDVYIAYLPLAHVLELSAELAIMSGGARLGFSSPFTLTGASPLIAQVSDKSPDAPSSPVLGDAVVLKPTVMAGVPAVHDKIRKAVTAKVTKAGGMVAWLFNKALSARIQALRAGSSAPFWERLVFDGLRKKVLGGKLRLIFSGGGPLSAETQEWVQAVFRAPMGQGYGLTETCGASTTSWANDRTFGRIGPPQVCTDIKLVSWEEGGYEASGETPRGEICMCGPNVTPGYYKMPEKTAKDFVMEGGRLWFHSGDIGQFDRDGVLRIIDRKKDLVKLSKGEYVALGKVEAKAGMAPCIFQLCLHVDSLQEYCTALVTLNKQGMPAPFKTMPDAQLIRNAEAADVAQKMVAKVCRESGLERFEIPTRLTIVGTEEWLPPTGLVTAALKLQRRKIFAQFADDVAAMYPEVKTSSGKR